MEKKANMSNNSHDSLQGPTGHRTTSFSVLDILDPNKFTSSRRLPQQHAGHRAERELGAFGAENRRGGAGEPGLEPAKGCYAPEEYPSSKSRLMLRNRLPLVGFISRQFVLRLNVLEPKCKRKPKINYCIELFKIVFV